VLSQDSQQNSESGDGSLSHVTDHPKWSLNEVQKGFKSDSIITKWCNDPWWRVTTHGIDPLEGI
ncbi:hypothetical protein HAX54_001206, partial [Datura stramonium]|nr:hypothetical protein [Datura stramonium]